MHYVPLNLQFGEKPVEGNAPRTVHAAWKWVDPVYQVAITKSIKDIKSIEIDPSLRMADVNRSNNKLVIPD
jgi:hypothetical protein